VKPIRSVPTAVAAALLVAAGMLLSAFRPPHLALSKSSPADGSTVAAVSEIRLWFSAAPMEMGPTTVELKLLDAGGRTLSTGHPTKDAKDPKVYSLAFPRGLEPRAYTVAWQTMADDGDVVKGQFRFTVAAAQELR
jgi:methionine-rich copper-binding protein CopC